jgi:hypothetical protein
MNGWDNVFMSTPQSGPGGAGVVSLGELGGGGVQSAGTVSQVTSAVSAPSTRSFVLPPVAWMFIFLLVGYWGLHQCLKAV